VIDITALRPAARHYADLQVNIRRSSMSRRWWFPFDGMEEMAFKHVQDGWVFGAPNPWLIGPRRYYLLNDAQKFEIVACLRRMWRLLSVGMLAMIAVTIPLVMPMIDARPLSTLAVAALAGLVIGIAANTYFYTATRPIIAGMEPTAERITQREAFRIQTAALSRGRIICFGLLSLALFALCAAQPLIMSARWDWWSLAGTLFFGITTIYWLVLFASKRGQPAT
jgi:hypothetical protein